MENSMTPTHLCEIDFYIDGELAPEDAGAFEVRLDSDMRLNALCYAVSQQKETLVRALGALDISSAVDRRTLDLQAMLAEALSRRITQARALTSVMGAK